MAIKVDNFEDVIVILMKDNQVRVVHGSINNSQPGIWQSRESANIVIVDCNLKSFTNWLDEIVNGAGETLREYRRQRIVWDAQQAHEPEEHPSVAGLFAGLEVPASVPGVAVQ
jgi:hypothetical protein